MAGYEELVMRLRIEVLVTYKRWTIINGPYFCSILNTIKEITEMYKDDANAIKYFYLEKARMLETTSSADELEIVRRIEF